MEVKLIFSDWLDEEWKSIYNTEKGIDLSMGDFHSGTTFDAKIIIGDDLERELKAAMKNGATPVFMVAL